MARKRVGKNIKAEVSKKAKKEEDDRSPFELIPREIKEKILKMIEKEIVVFSDFQKFWRLMFVNKEFYSIMSSQYMSYFDDITTMKVFCPVIYTSRYHEPKEMSDNVHKNRSLFHEIRLKIGWKDVPRYFEDKPFRIDCMWNQVDNQNIDDRAMQDFAEASERVFGVFHPQIKKGPEILRRYDLSKGCDIQ